MATKLSLPDIQGNQLIAAKNDLKLLAATPMQPSNRDPIAHGGYTRYFPRPVSKSKKNNPTEHDRSIFTNTTYFRSYYIIHPDWCSEGAGVRRLRTTSKPKVQYSWDRRPAVQPMNNYFGPLVQRYAQHQQQQQQQPRPQSQIVHLPVAPQPPPSATQSSYRPLDQHSYAFNRSFLSEKSRSGFF